MAIKKYSAGAIVYLVNNNEIQFLLLKNTLKNTYWEFPKGKIEDNESIGETAKREAREETNLDSLEIIPNFKHTNQWYYRREGQTINKEATFVIAKVPVNDKSKVKINKEHEDFEWLSYKEAMERMNIKNNQEMLKKAYKRIKEYEKQDRLF